MYSRTLNKRKGFITLVTTTWKVLKNPRRPPRPRNKRARLLRRFANWRKLCSPEIFKARSRHFLCCRTISSRLVDLSQRDREERRVGLGQAEPVLNAFRGLPINEVGPSLVKVKVSNGSGKEGQGPRRRQGSMQANAAAASEKPEDKSWAIIKVINDEDDTIVAMTEKPEDES